MSELFRFHVMLGKKKRTTISLPKYLLTMFALKQGYDLNDQKSLHKHIRTWCQKTLIEWDYNEHAINFSQFLHRKIVETILDNNLSKEYQKLFLDDAYEKIKF